MALVAWPGTSGIQWPYFDDAYATFPTTSATNLINATGEKAAILGRVRWTDRGTHDIHQVGWRLGTCVSAGGSGIVISLQNVHATEISPSKPDEVQDQTAAVLLSALTASGWNIQTLSADRTGVAHNTSLAVVWEFDGAGRLGADSFIVTSLNAGVSSQNRSCAIVIAKTAGVWATTQQIPNLVLIAADGTVGTLGYSYPMKAITVHDSNSGTTPDEVGNQFVLTQSATIEGVSLPFAMTTPATCALNLYEGANNTPIETLAVDLPTGPFLSTTGRPFMFMFDTPRDLSAGIVYRLTVQAITATGMSTVYSMDVHAANYLDLIGGQDMHYWDRTDDTWGTETLTRYVFMRLHFSRTSGGGGLRLAGQGGLV